MKKYLGAPFAGNPSLQYYTKKSQPEHSSMTRPRSQIISLDRTPWYHCVSRCVRQAFLCGNDRYTGKNFDHRKPWILERLSFLTQIFAINISAYAVMSNHFHLVLHVDRARAANWSNDEVLRRWTRLYKGPLLIQRHLAGQVLSDAEQAQLDELANGIRENLISISRFMACLNEYIARRANREDKSKGRFWEGRFKSQALLDVAALLSCMAYVDLNPVRAGLANGLRDSNYTSVQDRILVVERHAKPTTSQKTKAGYCV